MSERREELDRLLVQRATEGLDPEETRRLNELLKDFPEVDALWADRVVGELDAETVDETALAPELRETLLAAAPEEAERKVTELRPRANRLASWSGWAVAAALAALWLAPTQEPQSPQPLFVAVAAADDAVQAAWVPGEDATGADVSGEVVWSSSTQSGVMRFRGLAHNPPGEFQYQLWIFDEERDARYPVDGGVFDVLEGANETEVPVQAKLPVDSPTLFAVTVERPGGVVVSDRERIATLAQVGD